MDVAEGDTPAPVAALETRCNWIEFAGYLLGVLGFGTAVSNTDTTT